MASQFRDVLRDFALEKMKEIEQQESKSRRGSSLNKSARKETEAGADSETSEDRDKTDLRALISSRLAAMAAEIRENESKERKETQKKQHKHAKKDARRKSSKKKVKKHSSSKHKSKHKKKSSRHHSGHHSRKCRSKSGDKESVVKSKSHELTDCNVVMETRTDEGTNSDHDAQNSDTEDNSVDSDSERSVSPPFQLGKEVESADSNEEFTSNPLTKLLVESVVTTKDGDTQNIIEDRILKSRNGGEEECPSEESLRIRNKVEKVGLEDKDNLKPYLTPHEMQVESVREKYVMSQLNEQGGSEQFTSGKDYSSLESYHAGSKEMTDLAAHISQLEPKPSVQSINLPLAAVEVTPTLNNNDIGINTKEKEDMSKEKRTQLPEKGSDALTDFLAQDSWSEKSLGETEPVLQKSQVKAKVIKINIKTQELPENPSLSTEGSSAVTKVADELEESEDSNDDEESQPISKPWRIVPEEGEITPSSTENEDGKGEVGNKEEIEENREKRHRHKKHRKRKKSRQDGKEEGEIVEKKKRRNDGQEDETSSSKDKENASKNDEDKEDSKKLKLSQKKMARSSLGSVVSSQATGKGSNHLGRSRSRSRSLRHHRSRSRSSTDSGSYSPCRGYSHRSQSRSPRLHRSRSPESYHDKRYYERQRRRSRSRGRGRHRNRSNSRDRKRYRSRSHSKGRSWSRDRGRHRSRSLSKDRSRSRDRGRNRSKSSSRERKRRERSYTPVEEIDKKKLLEIAKANAYMYQRVLSGDLPATTKVVQTEHTANITKMPVPAAARTVDELTEVCKSLSKQEGDESSDDDAVNVPATSDDEEKDNFIRHPFQVKERPASIVVNIQNATPMPVLNSKETLRVQFPVSSGTQHRKKEDVTTSNPYGEWQPVKKPETILPAVTPVSTSSIPAPIKQAPPTVQPSSRAGPSVAASLPVPPAAPSALPLPGVMGPSIPPPVPVEDRVFEETPAENVNIADVVAMRLKAARALQTNPLDVEALSDMHNAQRKLQNWINRDNKPGLFTGSTDANILTPQQLANPNRKHQAWAKKDMFHNHTPVQGGIGMQLLQKMGWKQGEGLGKNKEGSTLPLMLDVKTDRKGLAAKDKARKSRTLPFVNSVPLQMTLPSGTQQNAAQKTNQIKTDFAGKHPVSVLNELCSKRKWRQPEYTVVLDDGPAHKKEYIFKVILNNEEYQGATSCNNKKEAKALAAQTALVKMGLLPPD